jgi:hypothetical protein
MRNSGDRMTGTKTAVFGIYHTSADAEHGASSLMAAGFSKDDVSVLLAEPDSSRELAIEQSTKAPEGTTAGVTAGGVIGGTLGLLFGIGAIAIPGMGLALLAAGPIMGTLAGLGAGGAVGGLIGALAGMGIPEYEAKRYEGRMKDGGVLLSVHCDSEEEITRASDLLRHTGAQDIASAGEAGADFKVGETVTHAS